MARVALAAAGLLVAAGPLGGQQPGELPFSLDRLADIPRAELNGITARGKLPAEYDRAAWHATDAVLAASPRDGLVEGYLARQRPDGLWEVVFGKLQSASSDTFRIAFRAVQKEPHSTAFTVYEMRPPTADVGYFAQAARALYSTRADFSGASRPYNAMVIPAGDRDEWFVYFVPAPTVSGVWPHGGDVRYRVRADGRAILERRRLHNTVLEFPPPARDGATLEFSFHTAVVDDRPEDTDVFHVLARTPRVKEYVVTQSFLFAIDTTGHIVAYHRSRR